MKFPAGTTAGIAWTAAAALGLYTAVQTQRMMALRADLNALARTGSSVALNAVTPAVTRAGSGCAATASFWTG